ncbi:MAG: ribokinase [Flexilinea sp.]
MEKQPVFVIGSLNLDIILKLDKLPDLGESMPVKGSSMCGGGKGGNQAVQCAKLGLETYMAGTIGNDFIGKILIDELDRYGVNHTYVKTVEGTSGFAVVNSVASGGIFATVVQGANYQITREDIDSYEDIFRKVQIVLLQLEIPQDVVEYTILKAKSFGCRVFLNAAPAMHLNPQIIRACDTIFMNEVEASLILGKSIITVEDAICAIQSYGIENGIRCVFTLGENGSVGFNGKKARYFPAIKTTVVETTGAGDSFIGGFTKAQLSGLDFFESISFAARCSMITIQGIGAQNSMPVLEQVVSYLVK